MKVEDTSTRMLISSERHVDERDQKWVDVSMRDRQWTSWKMMAELNYYID